MNPVAVENKPFIFFIRKETLQSDRMAPNKKTKTKKKNPRLEDDDVVSHIDIQYNPDIVDGLLQDIETQLEGRCGQIKKDVDFMATSIQQTFHLELIKLPNQVKTMTLRRFREEYGDSLEAVTRGAIGQGLAGNKKPLISNPILQTPTSKFVNVSTPARHPREGEQICSKNGSPLGEFSTAVKAPKSSSNLVIPQTPGVFVPLQSGDVIDLETVEGLPEELQEDALRKMQDMVSSIQAVMARIQK
jgi:hypothetical protein